MIECSVFISGHRNITQEEFTKYYTEEIDSFLRWVDKESSLGSKSLTFYIGDCIGCDSMAINYIADYITKHNTSNINIKLCMLCDTFSGQNNTIYNNKYIKIIKKFNTHEERDCYMTENTTYDILWVREGCWDSGTAQNYVRRKFHIKLH